MTKGPNPSGLEEVAALMLERQRLESWLATLDARKAATPDHVYQRVRGDYAARLNTVTHQLLARRAAVQTHLEQLSSRLTQLEAETQRFRDVRTESELRMQVGELSVTDWNVKARECDESIARLTDAQTQVRTQLGQARDIMNAVRTQTGGAVSSPRVPAVPTPSRPPARATPRALRPLTIEQAQEQELNNGGPPSSHVDELAFLNSVVGGEGPDSTSSDGQPEGAQELGESLLDRVNRSGQGSLREDADAESLLKPSNTSKPGIPKPSPLAANVTDANPIVLKPQGGPERHRTLKCGECGTMNFPTEWYCERCGAELAAV
jgi:hypothetical protein